MKKIIISVFILCLCIFCSAFADVINLRWLNEDGTIYQNSTCVIDGDLIIPATPPTKYGYTFTGWKTSNYVMLEYIESSGTQFINTGRQLSGTDTVELKISHFTPNGSDNMVFGVYDGGRSFALNIIRSGSGYSLNFYYASPVGQTLSNLTDFDAVHTIKIENRKVYVDDVLKITFNRSSDFTTGQNAELFSAGTYTAKIRIYYYKVTSSENILIQSFVPARRISDGVIGMYDTVSGQFFTNAGNGDFIAGPVLQ